MGRDPSSMPPANPEAGANESAETLSESPQPRGLANYSKREIRRISQFLPEGRRHAPWCVSDSTSSAMQPELGPLPRVLGAGLWCQHILRGTTILSPSGAGQLGGDVTGGPQCRSGNLVPLPEELGYMGRLGPWNSWHGKTYRSLGSGRSSVDLKMQGGPVLARVEWRG